MFSLIENNSIENASRACHASVIFNPGTSVNCCQYEENINWLRISNDC